MNTLNSEKNESNKFIYQFTGKLNLKNPNKNMALANLNIYYTWKNMKSEYNNNKFKISTPTWNYEFNLPDGSYSVSDIQDYFEYIIKNHETIADNSRVQVYVNKIKNKIVFKMKTGYKLELLTEETMQLLGRSKKDIDQDKDGEIVPKLENVEVVLVHCNLANNSYQQASKVLFTFVTNKHFHQLIFITPHSPIQIIQPMQNHHSDHSTNADHSTNGEFSFIEIWFTHRNNRSLQIEDNVNITLIIGTA